MATPFCPVVAVALLGVAPAGLTLAVITTPASLTGLLLASWSCTAGCWSKATPLCALLDGAVVSASLVAAPAVPCAVNVTGLPASDPAVAVNVFEPAVALRVQLPTAAIPFASVVWAAPVTLPLCGPGANVTDTPETGLPNASVTITDGGTATAVPAGACCALPPLGPIVAAAAGFSVTAAVSVTVIVPFTVAVTVFVPAAVELRAPVIWPLVLVVPAGCVNVIPVAGFAASVTVAPLTGLPLASLTVTVIVLALDPELAVIVPGEAATSD